MGAQTTDIAWAAGLFEGEGTWGYQRTSGGNSVSAALHMTDFEVVERFHAIVGVGKVRIKTTKNPKHNPTLCWRVTDRAGVSHVLELLRPWLGARRIARGEEVLRLQAEYTAASERARAETCQNGHRRTPENTGTQRGASGNPCRKCLICARAAGRRNRVRQRPVAA